MEEEEEEAVRQRAAQRSKSRIARTLHKVVSLRTSTRIGSNNGIGICMLAPQDRVNEDERPADHHHKSHHHADKTGDAKAKQRAVLEAVVAKLFAGVTTIKAAYAELQMAQSPYSSEAIQEADRAIVDELKQISELKRKFLRKELDISPQVTVMLAEIQEQQSLMKTYEITVKKMEAQVELKETEACALRKKLDDVVSANKALDKKLNASGCLPLFDNFKLSSLNPSHFVQVLHYALRSVRNFVKVMIREMESARWDLDEAIKFIEPKAQFARPNHRYFAFESYVAKSMLEGFDSPDFALANESSSSEKQSCKLSFDQFKRLKSVSATHFISQNPSSSLARFTKAKYLQVVHAKMECSFFGNLNQRKAVTANGCPDSSFFAAFAEMSRRLWILHRLAFSFDQEVSIFQVRRDCRFSEVFMECVTEEIVASGPDIRVGFTVVPGFKIGKTVIQCHVYLFPPASGPTNNS